MADAKSGNVQNQQVENQQGESSKVPAKVLAKVGNHWKVAELLVFDDENDVAIYDATGTTYKSIADAIVVMKRPQEGNSLMEELRKGIQAGVKMSH